MFFARQRLGKQIPAPRIRKQQSRCFGATTMETVFSVGSIPRLYNKDPRPVEEIIEGVP
jgi:hypothetical protein